MTSTSGHSATGQVATGLQAPAIEPEGLSAGQRPDAAAATPTSHDAGPVWALLLPPVAALVFSLWSITTPSYWRDEAATVGVSNRPFGDLIKMLGHVDVVHSAYYIIMWPVEHLFGPGELAMRLPSALAAAVTAAFVAAIGRRLVSPWTGLAAGLLYAVLPVTSRYGQEARSFAMVVAAATIASYLLMRTVGAEPERRGRWLIGYGACLTALGILNIFGLLLIPAHAVTLALRFRNLRGDRAIQKLLVGWLGAAVVAVVVTSPVIVLGYQQRAQVAWIAINRSSSGLKTLLTLSGSALLTVLIAGIIAVALIFSSDAAGAPAERQAAWRWSLTELSLPWMLLPPALLIGASVISPIYTSRYVLMCIPAVALLGGMAVVALGRIAGPVALGLVLVAGIPAQVDLRQPSGHWDNVRALDQIVAANARPGDVVLYANPNAAVFGSGYSYGLGRLPNIALRQAANTSGTLAGTWVGMPTLRSRLAQASRVWVVEINHCVSEPQVMTLGAANIGPAVYGLPMHFVKIWHERGDWLLLYQHGAGSQELTTACRGHR